MKADKKQFDEAAEQRVIAIGQAMIAAAKAQGKLLGSDISEVAEAADHVASITSTVLIEQVEKTIGKEKAMHMALLFANIYRDRAADFMVTYAKLHKAILEDDKLKQEAKEEKQ